MQSYIKFLELFQKYSPEILGIGKEVFAFDRELNEKIEVDDSDKIRMLWYDSKEHKVLFSSQGYKKDISFREIKNKFGFENAGILRLSHEISHYIHDAKTEYSLFEQIKNLDDLKRDVAFGICEGIAFYASSKIIEKFGMKQMEIAEYEYKSFVKILQRRLPKIRSLNLNIIRYCFSAIYGKYYQTIFENKGLDYFRKFTKEWRPNKIDENDIKNLEEILKEFPISF